VNICIPVLEDKGLDSPVSLHFGSAPVFLIVDTAGETCRAVPNKNLHHNHGMCQPLMALAGEDVNAVVVGGIGMGALGKLRAANIEVYLSDLPTVKETLAALGSGSLQPVTAQTACGHHGHGHH
jgi:predicted Fe-Mo cluster-binding NifX family protein